MRQIMKGLMLTFCFIMLIFSRPNMALAEIVEQDDLKVKLQLDQVENNSKEVKATLKITNIGIRQIDDIDIKSVIPAGIKIKNGSASSYKIEKLGAGESSTYEFICEIEQKLLPTPDDGGNDGSLDTPDDGGNNDTESEKPVINIVTGDSGKILLFLLVMIVSLVVLLRINNKNAKTILSVFLCITLVSGMLGNVNIAQANEIEKKNISVKEGITIGNNTYLIETIVSYKVGADTVKPSGNVISRGEWISKVVDATDLIEGQELDIDDFEYPFDDIEGHEYEQEIIFADIYEILDVEEGLFNPDEPATREFVALTSVRALGFNATEDIICDDVNEIKFLKEVETAVSMKIMSLENNKFYPSREMTEGEVQYVLEGITAILNSTEVDENYDNTFEYKEGVIELEDKTSYEVNQSTVTLELNDVTENLKKDDIFILPNEKPCKVVSIIVEKNKVIIETSEPEIEETLDYIDIQGNAIIDVDQFIPAEGVEVIQNNNGDARLNIDEEGSIHLGRGLNLKINAKINDYMKATGSVSFNLKEISYKADIDMGLSGVDVNNVFMKLNTDLNFSGGLSAGTDGFNGSKHDGYFELGKVPVAAIPGVGIYVQFGLEYSVEGEVKLVCSYAGNSGVQLLNNRPRKISTGNVDASFQANATGKIGPGVKGLLEICQSWDLIDLSSAIGATGNAQIERHPSMVCIDLSAHEYWYISALKESEINDWLGLELEDTWNILDEDHHFININFHSENLNKVPECTYGKSIIKGTVAKAGNRGEFIKNALIQVYKSSNNRLIAEAYSDSNGKYTIEDLKQGDYRIRISKNGYITFESMESLSVNQEKYIETFLMVGQGYDGEEGIAGGKITDALTGGDISNISIKIRNGWNNTTGDVIKTATTNVKGIYQVTLPLGNYTVEMSKSGYLTKSYNIYVKSGSSLDQNNTLIPESGEMPAGDLRIVLTWDESPRDLDSHLIGPTVDGEGYFHTYYNNKKYYVDGVTYADLDLDDTTSYGPETTTVYNMNETGKYSFYVHDYTNRKNNYSTAMSNSGAKVEVYKGDILYAVYNIPANNEGTYWHVFDYDAELNSIVPVNQFVNGIEYRNSKMNSLSKSLWQMEEKSIN